MTLGTVESIAVIIGVLIGVLGFLFGLATVIGGNYRVAKNAKVVADYEAGYKGLEAKAKGQEQQISELQRENGEKDTKIAELEHELADLRGRMAILQEVVTGKSALEELTRQLATLADTMNRRAEMVNSRIGETLAMVGQLRTDVQANHTAIAGILTAVTTGDGTG